MYKLIVMDYGIGEMFIYGIDPNITDPEELKDDNDNYVINKNCEWMVVSGELKINFK
jgi:hypothetical protein